MEEIYRTKKPENEKHRFFIGDKWEEIGMLQYEFLKSQGLMSNHRLLDIGCGCLRLGCKAIPYLDKGNYYGMEMHQELLDMGVQKELGEGQKRDKQPNLICHDKFEFELFGTSFDFMIAQSVFTHLPMNQIQLCMTMVKRVLKKDGVFFATILENSLGDDLNGLTSNPYYQHILFYEYLAKMLDLSLEYIGDWKHPRDLKILAFRLAE